MRLPLPRAVAAALILSASSLASAAPDVVVPTFTLDFAHDAIEPPSVISTDASKTVLSLHPPGERTHVVAGGSSGQTVSFGGDFNITAADGYRITGLGFSASVTGSFQAGQPPAGATNVRYGDAGNRVWVWFTVDSAQPQLLYRQDYLTAEAIDVALAVPGAGTDVAVSMTVDLTAWGFGTYFTPIDPEGADKVYGRGQIDLWNPQLTVYTEALPVPEPSNYLMLGVGLALVGARRQLMRRGGQA